MPGVDESPDTNWEGEDLSAKLKYYYGRLFPADLFYKWLSYGASFGQEGVENSFPKREFCFTLEGDIFCRYHSFTDGAALQAELVKRLPVKIDLGAVFTVQPKTKASVAPEAFKPVQRELVFDIDLTDYDDIRTCCSAANICGKCWKYMRVAVKVMDDVLRGDFGFKHLLWVYSGRRGIHCWVCDESARFLSDEGRSSVAEYLRVVTGGDKTAKRTNLWGKDLHPSLLRAFEMHLLPAFEEIVVEDQGLLNDSEHWVKVLDLIRDEELRSEIEKHLDRNPKEAPAERWEWMRGKLEARNRQKGQKFNCLYDVVFPLTYPRLDIEVSKHQNHLLKAPFCIHPSTECSSRFWPSMNFFAGRVCVPFEVADVDNFSPDAVPTVNELLTQLNAQDKADPARKIKDSKKTVLQDSIKLFKKSFLDPMFHELNQQAQARSLKRQAESAPYDF